VAAERSDWSVWMNLSSLHALAEQHLSQTADEFESVPHQHTQNTLSLREPYIQQEKRARERKGNKRLIFYLSVYKPQKRECHR